MNVSCCIVVALKHVVDVLFHLLQSDLFFGLNTLEMQTALNINSWLQNDTEFADRPFNHSLLFTAFTFIFLNVKGKNKHSIKEIYRYAHICPVR